MGLQMIAGLRGENPDIVFLAPTDTDKLTLAWLPTSNDSTASSEMKYEVHLSEQSNFQPSDATRRSTVTGDAQAKIEGLKTGTTYYAVIVAVDKSGGKTKGRYYSSAKTFANPLIQSNAVVNIDSDLGLNGAVQNGTQYVYPKTAGATLPASGSILFGKVGQETYMRKVVSATATADSIIIETADAELSQVFDQAAVSTGTKLFNIGQVAAQSAQRSVRSDGSRHSVIRWKDDLLVAEQTDHAGETEDVSLSPGAGDNEYRIHVKRDSDSAGVEPKIEFTPSIDVNVDWHYDLLKGVVINGAQVIARGTLSAELRAFYNFSSSGTVSKENSFSCVHQDIYQSLQSRSHSGVSENNIHIEGNSKRNSFKQNQCRSQSKCFSLS
ncbi:MAG: fibronectin type III domain-containing protein [Desulfobacteraceae bacterium]|nr:fibronectin type III domain-containing protein [Desulfobacteraceae bacterium]